MSFGSFQVSFGSFWASFGSFWVSFGSFWVSFGSFWASRWVKCNKQSSFHWFSLAPKGRLGGRRGTLRHLASRLTTLSFQTRGSWSRVGGRRGTLRHLASRREDFTTLSFQTRGSWSASKASLKRSKRFAKAKQNGGQTRPLPCCAGRGGLLALRGTRRPVWRPLFTVSD